MAEAKVKKITNESTFDWKAYGLTSCVRDVTNRLSNLGVLLIQMQEISADKWDGEYIPAILAAIFDVVTDAAENLNKAEREYSEAERG